MLMENDKTLNGEAQRSLNILFHFVGPIIMKVYFRLVVLVKLKQLKISLYLWKIKLVYFWYSTNLTNLNLKIQIMFDIYTNFHELFYLWIYAFLIG